MNLISASSTVSGHKLSSGIGGTTNITQVSSSIERKHNNKKNMPPQL
jgi:hypothetical protein